MVEMVKTGVIGTGYMGALHLKTYAALSASQLVGFVETDGAKRNAISKQFKIPGFSTVDELLETDVEAISIASPTETHFEISRKCIEADKHVLIEKPLCQKIDQCKKLVALSEKSSKVVIIGHLERFNPAVQKMFELLGKRRPTVFSARRIKGKPNRLRNTGVVYELGVHDIDLMIACLGMPANVSGRLIKKNNLEVDAQMFFGFEKSAGVIHSSWLFEGINKRDVALSAEERTISADLLEGAVNSEKVERTEPIASEIR
ncbi:Gfo/Idh/MocA family oxidoreductase, partial [Candidatus Micrarchaeota archaeon]|nr:Gfo/Idh/MocA family oxidoreductase [Candidatus Micrarchaeota archaeon]